MLSEGTESSESSWFEFLITIKIKLFCDAIG